MPIRINKNPNRKVITATMEAQPGSASPLIKIFRA